MLFFPFSSLMNRSFRFISTRWNEKAFKLPPVNNLFFLFYEDNIASIKIVWKNRGEKNKIPDNVFIFIFACVFLIFSHLSVFSRGWCLHEYSFTFQFVCSFQTLHFVRVSVFWSQPWQSVSRDGGDLLRRDFLLFSHPVGILIASSEHRAAFQSSAAVRQG